MEEKKEKAAFRRALAEEMMRAAPEMLRKHRQEAANRADIERRVQGCQNAIEERRKDYAAQMKQKDEAARAPAAATKRSLRRSRRWQAGARHEKRRHPLGGCFEGGGIFEGSDLHGTGTWRCGLRASSVGV